MAADSQGLSLGLAHEALSRVLRRGGDFAEIFAEDRASLSLRLEDGKVEEVSSGRDRGASIRLVKGPTTSFGYSESMDEASLLALADDLSAGLSGAGVEPAAVRASASVPLHVVRVRPADVAAAEKANLVRVVDEAARAWSPEVRQVIAGYSEGRQRVWVANSRGTYASDDRTRVVLAVTAVAQRDDVIQTGRETVAGPVGYELFSENDVAAAARLAAEKAVVMLGARPSPTGRMPVILANGFGGVLFHEACGHGLEADFIVKKTSVWEGQLGTRVAEPFVTALDDGVTAGYWGSNAIDDEGTPSERTVVIEDGVLVGYLTDLLRGEKLGLASTGNGRRQSFRHLPYPPHDQHLLRPGHDDRGRADRQHTQGLLRQEPCRRAGGPGHRRLRLRRVGRVPGRERARGPGGEGGHAHRQRAGGAAQPRRHRLRSGAQSRHLRQGRPAGPSGERPAHDPSAGVDRRGHERLMARDLLDIARDVLARGRRLPGELEVYVEHSRTTSIKVFDGEIESLVTGEPRGVGVRYLGDHRRGYAYTADFSDEGLDLVVREAAANAEASEPDPHVALPEAPVRAYPEVPGLWRPELVATPVQEKVALALMAERVALGSPEIETVEESAYIDSASRVAIASSRGVEAAGEQTFCYVYLSAHARRGHDVQTATGFSTGRAPADLDAEASGRDAAVRAAGLLGAAPCPSGRYTAVLDREVAASVLGVISQALTAEAVQKGRSLFAGRVGQAVGSERVRLVDDGLRPGGMATAPFDDEGVPRGPLP
ncbi:MAG: TldD/PmbA family protein [Thermoleophilia bacterium]|nr:TldD/PmbA family protein [Thermoleophilia bacterium]